jgi:hypothetical protein
MDGGLGLCGVEAFADREKRVRRHATDYFRAPGLSAPANDATMFRPTNASFMGTLVASDNRFRHSARAGSAISLHGRGTRSLRSRGPTDYFRAPGLSAPANDATMFRPTNASFMGGAGLFSHTEDCMFPHWLPQIIDSDIAPGLGPPFPCMDGGYDTAPKPSRCE